ncbi:hypothetical protein [Faecalispora jeddahensis]|uniref:hypothetical protein n=1 Tax=Faecalispora jeddahensis TaxID=1414721 RepID=UPI0018972874|nr:hypothetical protein [Faecalispora jeddahensis]
MSAELSVRQLTEKTALSTKIKKKKFTWHEGQALRQQNFHMGQPTKNTFSYLSKINKGKSAMKAKLSF